MTKASAEVGSSASSYEILAKLAEGGMAEIFLARGASDAGVARYVVLKRVLRGRANDPHFLKMFLDEARLAAQLQHPNIAQVYDIGKLGDSYFFTMEYVHGETVRAILQRASALKRPIPLGCVLTIATGAAAGLHHAHERIGVDRKALNIVHRDVSPSNLMVGYEGHVKLVDFGVAKATDRIQETRSGTVKGKISYMSPEQCRGHAVDRRSDLFSLGIVLWEMLTTERLFRKESDFESMAAIVEKPVVAPSTKRAEVPPELDAAVLKLLAKSPDDRYATADELLADLETIATKAASVMSSASLGRVMREMFGPRPEPWVEFDEQELSGKAVTVTSEPIPAQFTAAPVDEVALQLAQVSDLRALRPEGTRAPSIPAAPQPAEAQPTPAEPADGDDDGRFVEMDTSKPTRARAAVFTGQPTTKPGVEPASATRTSTPEMKRELTVAPAQSSLGPAPFAAAPTAAPPILRKKFPLVLALFAALIAFVVVLVVFRGGDEPAAPMEDVATPTETAPATDPPTIEVPAAVPANTIEKTVGIPDATQETQESADPPTLDDAIASGKWELAVAACDQLASAFARHAATCALAACKAKNAAKAKRWVTSVATNKRAPIHAACRAAKINLEPKRTPAPGQPKPDCAKNPLDCQR